MTPCGVPAPPGVEKSKLVCPLPGCTRRDGHNTPHQAGAVFYCNRPKGHDGRHAFSTESLPRLVEWEAVGLRLVKT